ncbi:uncharacterized protein LOC119011914 isoform X3 [Acanthopagrus latus]|uniref:uncharacterized protein LOC119011914 isoform X3 n=1 Tax=Acanthopagrus latus TaxID=8177 RepID=UPI00187CB37D|nr:uncharacterized protein LOC119011914 isoform X3 [Acanthopagrus latus]
MNPHVEDGPHCSVDLTWSVSDRTSISRSAHPPGQQMCSVHTQWEDPAQQDHSYCQTARGKDVRDMITQCDEFGYFMLQNDADALLYTACVCGSVGDSEAGSCGALWSAGGVHQHSAGDSP